jgi:glycosidase
MRTNSTGFANYIQSLGCTALWLSPIFENNASTYHGYGIQNYLEVDPRFGTRQEMAQLVDEAHRRDMRVFLDIVLNHSGDNWAYPEDQRYYYYQGEQFPFGAWRRSDRPLPVEMRDPELYTRKGEIRNWDTYPETRDGDFFGFKNFLNESEKGLLLQQLLIDVHCYWIRETDVDGFRVDAAKHMGELAVARFCSSIREYAYTLGKRNFFLFGELVGNDEISNRYIGPHTSKQIDHETIYFGLNSVLDFPLYYVLGGVIQGTLSPVHLLERYRELDHNVIQRGELGNYLITFLDNHDQVGVSYKQRFGATACDQQIIAGIAFLLCAVGTPCLYYGTEQGFSGQGEGDQYIREAMFDPDNPEINALNVSCTIYQAIARLARLHRDYPPIQFGRMFWREVSTDGRDFSLPQGQPCVLAFSRVLFREEIVYVYNTSVDESVNCYVRVEETLHQTDRKINCLYGEGTAVLVRLEAPNRTITALRLTLAPKQIMVLR